MHHEELPRFGHVQSSLRASLPALQRENHSDGGLEKPDATDGTWSPGRSLLPRSSPICRKWRPRTYRAAYATMVAGALAVHQAGHFLALLKVVPRDREPVSLGGGPYPFLALPDGSEPAPYPPMLLPGDRYLMYSCPQGMLVLDLWSCHGLSAKDNDPQYRLIRCQHRSLAAAPIPPG